RHSRILLLSFSFVDSHRFLRHFPTRRSSDLVGKPHLVEAERAGLVDPTEQGVRDGTRLLGDLLEHEVVVAVLLRGRGVPVDVERDRKSTRRTPVTFRSRMPSSARKKKQAPYL